MSAAVRTPAFSVLIPARMASSRLPDKPLADIAGLPMVVRVARQAQLSGARQVVVAADDPRILSACAEHGVTALLTRAVRPSSGTTPGAGTTYTVIVSPFTSSGRPMAAAMVTSGRATTTDSISVGPIRFPAMLSVSSERPWRNQKPSSSIDAQSP